jgi:hypothetical protein
MIPFLAGIGAVSLACTAVFALLIIREGFALTREVQRDRAAAEARRARIEPDPQDVEAGC